MRGYLEAREERGEKKAKKGKRKGRKGAKGMGENTPRNKLLVTTLPVLLVTQRPTIA